MNYSSDDRFFRFTFADTNRIAGLLREFLPQNLLMHLDLPRIKRVHENNVSDALKELRDDLNFMCPLQTAGKVLIRIIVEHKSAYDPRLWLQLMKTINASWETDEFTPVIPVVIHTGPDPFVFTTPKSRCKRLPIDIANTQPTLIIHPIDLAIYTMQNIWESQNLDHISKVALSILKLAQQKNLEIGEVRKILNKQWPNLSTHRKNRHLRAAISYLKHKSIATEDELQKLDKEMKLAHPINPKSVFAHQLLASREEGIEVGIEKGIEIGRKELDIRNIEIIQGMLNDGLDWGMIERITHINETTYQALLVKHGKALN